MSKQDEQDFCIMVVTICALVLAFLFMCCAAKTVFDKQHRPAGEKSEEAGTSNVRNRIGERQHANQNKEEGRSSRCLSHRQG